ncbi:6,7-dimethyl-8-ribityllumazine synthase [candidate division KSB3 bacterium]|uniref:6,7-dimethyl-8-ribityllumazine synthase n=1 Tax=candidate division KSB3 bacterium TaxID=2044937 RepID=A0A9D5JVB0_9BACT|nr:6,7-dimethyl-8-ribityllumazine synthase [candidate division KSB3 bacterium]MBD3324938.1 6,7-dimethyl-8-ribityllumazine synthase [candidate division KSB3 bacterium]
MPHTFEGQLRAEGIQFGIVVSRFNSIFTERLLEGALDALYRHGADEGHVDIVRVPGSFEIPLAAKAMAGSKRYDAVICLGAVIQGATPHAAYISAEVTKGIAQVSLDTGLPISYGVITPDTLEQAIERSGSKAGNKGWEAAMSAIEMVNVLNALTT